MTGTASTCYPRIVKETPKPDHKVAARRGRLKRSLGRVERQGGGEEQEDAGWEAHRSTFPPVIYTLGHSTRPIEALLALLAEHAVELLVDVRRFPGSRRYPQFGRDALAASLGAAGVEYRHEVDLGGRRRGAPDSPNTFWRNAGFRGYADYLASPEAVAALERLGAEARERRLAIMCAEAVPWRCHRQLISDALVSRGIEVVHILAPGRTERHTLNAQARVQSDGRLIYPQA
jgi:hypothetical protein